MLQGGGALVTAEHCHKNHPTNFITAPIGLNACTVFSRFHSIFESLFISNSVTARPKSTSKTSFMSWNTANMVFHVKCYGVSSVPPPYHKLLCRLWSDMRQSSLITIQYLAKSPGLPLSIWRIINALSSRCLMRFSHNFWNPTQIHLVILVTFSYKSP